MSNYQNNHVLLMLQLDSLLVLTSFVSQRQANLDLYGGDVNAVMLFLAFFKKSIVDLYCLVAVGERELSVAYITG